MVYPGAERGEKITSVRLADGTKLENDKYYTVVTNDFMAVGGDSYDFSAAKNVVDTNLVIRDEMANYWRENGIDPITDLATLLEAGEDTTVDSEKPENPENPDNGENLPNTGMPFGTGAVAAMGTVLTIGGLAVLRKRIMLHSN